MLSLLKTLKVTSSASAWWENTKSSFKGNTRVFSKSSTTQENIRISKPKKDYKLVQKGNFEPKTKRMIENLQNEFYQLKNKQAKSPKFCSNIRQELEGEKRSKTLFIVLGRQNMQIQAIFELHADYNKSKYPKDIVKSAKKSSEKLFTKQTSTVATIVVY